MPLKAFYFGRLANFILDTSANSFTPIIMTLSQTTVPCAPVLGNLSLKNYSSVPTPQPAYFQTMLAWLPSLNLTVLYLLVIKSTEIKAVLHHLSF